MTGVICDRDSIRDGKNFAIILRNRLCLKTSKVEWMESKAHTHDSIKGLKWLTSADKLTAHVFVSPFHHCHLSVILSLKSVVCFVIIGF